MSSAWDKFFDNLREAARPAVDAKLRPLGFKLVERRPFAVVTHENGGRLANDTPPWRAMPISVVGMRLFPYGIEAASAENLLVRAEIERKHIEAARDRIAADPDDRDAWRAIGGGLSIPADHQIGVRDCRCVACRPK